MRALFVGVPSKDDSTLVYVGTPHLCPQGSFSQLFCTPGNHGTDVSGMLEDGPVIWKVPNFFRSLI